MTALEGIQFNSHTRHPGSRELELGPSLAQNASPFANIMRRSIDLSCGKLALIHSNPGLRRGGLPWERQVKRQVKRQVERQVEKGRVLLQGWALATGSL